MPSERPLLKHLKFENNKIFLELNKFLYALTCEIRYLWSLSLVILCEILTKLEWYTYFENLNSFI